MNELKLIEWKKTVFIVVRFFFYFFQNIFINMIFHNKKCIQINLHVADDVT